MTHLELLISEEQILQKIKEIGNQIESDYAKREIVIVMVMKGAICLVADLIRQLHLPCAIEFVQGRSYGAEGTKRGKLFVSGIENLDIAGKDLLLVDDIFDSGTTLSYIKDKLAEKNPKSLKTLVLLSKKISRNITWIPDYVLFEIENRFVVGYGLDYKEHFRGLPGVYILQSDEEASLSAHRKGK